MRRKLNGISFFKKGKERKETENDRKYKFNI